MAAESIINRKALRDYHISDRYEAGIELKGSEVKSIRAGKANIGDAFARIENGEAFLYNADIQPYERASHEIPTAKRMQIVAPSRGDRQALWRNASQRPRARGAKVVLEKREGESRSRRRHGQACARQARRFEETRC